jgi:hypothetical protein
VRTLLTISCVLLAGCADPPGVPDGTIVPDARDDQDADAGGSNDAPGAMRDAVTHDAIEDLEPEEGDLPSDGSGDVGPDTVAADTHAPDANATDPLQAPADTWTWIDIPGTQCADGSPTGLGINLHPGATRLFIYLEGGGACWNYDNCFGLLSTALHLDGFDADTFDSLITDVYLNSLTFSRDDPKNPLRDAHFVFLPYCTADIFAGDAEVEMENAFGNRRTMYFKGRPNMSAYLKRLAPTFPNVDHVVVAGSSAGGFGAAVSWPQVRAHFPGRRVDLIDDSGPPVDPREGLWAQWQTIWNLEMPPDCPDCAESVRALRNYYRRYLTDDGSRIAFVTYARDTVISTFMGILPIVFEERVRAMCEEFSDEPSAQCFVVWGRLHTLLLLGTENESGGLPLWRWLELMLDGDQAWNSTLP